MTTSITYKQIIIFLLPLTLTNLIISIGDQALNRGLTSAESAAEALASFGIAFFLCQFMVGPVIEFRNVSLVLVRSRRDLLIVLYCLFGVSGILFVLSLVIALTSFGTFLSNTVYSLSDDVGAGFMQCMLFLSAWPAVEGITFVMIGLHLSVERSIVVGAAQVIDVFLRIVSVVVLLQTNIPQTIPLMVPILSMYMGGIGRCSFLFLGYFRYIHGQLKKDTPVSQRLKVGQVFSFWWPLAVVTTGQRISRPLASLFVSRDLSDNQEEAAKAIATLTVCYPTSMITYLWLNESRVLFPLFLSPSRRPNEDLNKKDIIKHLTRFNIGYFLVSFSVCLIVFWIPGVITTLLMVLLGVSEEIAEMCVLPLKIATGLPIMVSIRAHMISWLMYMKQTAAICPSAILRLAFVVAFLFLLPLMGMHGAPMGMLALLFGFTAEAIGVVAGAACVKRFKKPLSNNNTLPNRATTKTPPSSLNSSSENLRCSHRYAPITEKETSL
ncbi:progressive ankylosis protein homolog [Asterias amurensis]|uniref:progressive ankylosis protein homolog n=1 Tax=Asterias amurensis TaxID=7602 RepID=UPI003AB8D6BB